MSLMRQMLMKYSDFYERGYATDVGSLCEEEWTERIFIYADVLSRTASHDGTPLPLSSVEGSAYLYSIIRRLETWAARLTHSALRSAIRTETR
jgi:hypothetical protein